MSATLSSSPNVRIGRMMSLRAGEESVSPVQAGEDSDNGGETVVPADAPGASGTDRKKLLLIVAAPVLSIFIVSSLILMFSSGKTARPVVPSPPVSSSQPKTEKESGKATADSKPLTEKKQAPAPSPSPSHFFLYYYGK